MINIAKADQIPNYTVEVDIADVDRHSNDSTIHSKYLDIAIKNDDYYLSFIIGKEINEILNIEKYEKMELSSKDIFDSMFSIGDESPYLGEVEFHNIVINMFNDDLVISFEFSCHKEYYGNAEIEIKIDKIKELATEK